MVSKNYYKLAYYNFVKQSKAKPLLYLLTNNLNFYISQFFKTLKFLDILFCNILKVRHYEGKARSNLLSGLLHSVRNDDFNYVHTFSYALKNNFAILINKGLQPLVLTSITFDSLSRKIKNPCLVINKFIFLRRIFA